MASSKAKVGANSETNSLKESKSNASSSAGEASAHNRIYSLEELDTIATVGELQQHVTETLSPALHCTAVPGVIEVQDRQRSQIHSASNNKASILQ